MKINNDNLINDWLQLFAENFSTAQLAAAEILSEISRVITNTRISKKMTQTEFASFMGVSQSMVSKWENGDYNFTIEKIIEIADKLDLDFSFKLQPSLKEITVITNDEKSKIIQFNTGAYRQSNSSTFQNYGYTVHSIEKENHIEEM